MKTRQAVMITAGTLCGLTMFSVPVVAQEPDLDVALEEGGEASSMQWSGYTWLTPHHDEMLTCRVDARLPGYSVTAIATIETPDGPINKITSGFGFARAIAVMPSAFNASPGEFICRGSAYASNGGQAGPSELPFRSTRYWGSYDRAIDWGADVDYEPYNCSHEQMWPSNITMSKPVPGYPDEPPLYMGDEGFFLRGSGLYRLISFFIPRSSPGLCQAAQ